METNRSLITAILSGNLTETEKSLKSGADPNTHVLKKRSGLDYCAEKDFGAIIKILLLYGANPLEKNEFGEMPLEVARRCNSTFSIAEFTNKSVNVYQGQRPKINKTQWFINEFPSFDTTPPWPSPLKSPKGMELFGN